MGISKTSMDLSFSEIQSALFNNFTNLAFQMHRNFFLKK